MPRIGMRIVKSAIAVYICIILGLLRPGGMAFYSAIAAVLCMQPYLKNSINAAINRTIGTLFGGIFGIVALLIERNFQLDLFPTLDYFVISLLIIPLIYVTVLSSKTNASYIAVVVFLSVAVNHGADINVYSFAFNRIIDTLIGIFVSLGINMIHMPIHKKNNSLYVLPMKQFLESENKEWVGRERIKLNRLIDKGSKVVFYVPDTPIEFVNHSGQIHHTLPIIALGGVVGYDIEKNSYVFKREIDKSIFYDIEKQLRNFKCNYFVYTVENEVLHIHYEELKNSAEIAFYNKMKILPYQNISQQKIILSSEILIIKVIALKNKILEYDQKLKAFFENCGVALIIHDIDEFPEYSSLTIQNEKATIENAVASLDMASIGEINYFDEKQRDILSILNR